MAGRKLEHLNEQIQQKLATILLRESQDPRFHSVTITAVNLAKDLSFAMVDYACFQSGLDHEDLTLSLNRAAGFFSRALGRTLATRRTPKLQFQYDRGFDFAYEMDVVLNRIKQEED